VCPRGAYGIVFRAIERATGRNWALKFVSCGAVEKQLVRQEAAVMNELHHPRLLQLHDAFDLPGEMAMVLEL
jgi:serine/threonine protein kinase